MTDKTIVRKNKEAVDTVVHAKTLHKAMVIETLGFCCGKNK